jgi:hypothetical protein
LVLLYQFYFDKTTFLISFVVLVWGMLVLLHCGHFDLYLLLVLFCRNFVPLRMMCDLMELLVCCSFSVWDAFRIEFLVIFISFFFTCTPCACNLCFCMNEKNDLLALLDALYMKNMII